MTDLVTYNSSRLSEVRFSRTSRSEPTSPTRSFRQKVSAANSRCAIRFSLLLLIVSSAAITNVRAVEQNDPTSVWSARRSKKKPQSSSSAQSAPSNSSKVDLNTASKQELAALPGIGEVYAQKIIDGRPYESENDLVKKGILSNSDYEKVKNSLTAHGTNRGQPNVHRQ